MRHNRERVLSLRLLSLALCFSGTALAHSDSHLALKGKHARLVARDDSPAYNDPTTLNPPAIPSPAPATAFDLALPTSPSGLSITHSGAFIGFSVEFSVSTIVLGKKANVPYDEFVNLMGNLQKRAGRVPVRVGGNSQEDAILVDSANLGTAILRKDGGDDSDTYDGTTPRVLYSKDLITLMGTISKKVDIGWFLGIPFNYTDNHLAIAEVGQSVLGDSLIGLQAANEPDFYGRHGLRKPDYSPSDYFTEFGNLVKEMSADSKIPTPNMLMGPSTTVTVDGWQPDDVWATGFLDTYKDNLVAITHERYPASNCADVKGIGQDVNPQDLADTLFQHKAATDYVAPFLGSAQRAQAAGKPLYMMEWNTGTCSGFPGLSNSFGATLWALDAGLQMAYSNFSSALLHVGGKNAYYNPFTAPLYSETPAHKWTIGAVYYSALAIAEALGASGKARVLDLNANSGSGYTPAYAVYEDGAPTRVALFNYITDASGAHDYTATVAVPAGVSSVNVKYLKADSVASKSGLTWAGQTLGGTYESTGLLTGAEDVQTVACAASKCAVKVPAPGFALVFLTAQALADSTGASAGAAASASANASGTAKASGSKATASAAATGGSASTSGSRAVAAVSASGMLGVLLLGAMLPFAF